jgi:predicted nucleic acid-binding protein
VGISPDFSCASAVDQASCETLGFDIRADRPKPTDVFLVDTNVWVWMTYSVASQTPNPRVQSPPAAYPKYFKRALAARARFCWCGLSLSELAHTIEKAEFSLFAATNPKTSAKEYRHNLPAERAHVVNEIQAAWGAFKQIAKPIELVIGSATTDAALARLSSQHLDGHDLFLLESMAGASVTQLLTDDGDFCTVPGIQVFTANRQVIEAAQNQGKLLAR